MPAERRSLRSNKSETSSSANGEKPRSDSQSSSNKKDRPTHSRSASSRSKSISNKKGATNLAKDMSGDKPHVNGTDPIENGINGTEDTEMGDDPSQGNGKPKPAKDKDGDEEMTVVVPPSKGTKVADTPSKDKEGDVAMNGTPEAESTETAEPAVDPKAKAIAGEYAFPRLLFD